MTRTGEGGVIGWGIWGAGHEVGGVDFFHEGIDLERGMRMLE